MSYVNKAVTEVLDEFNYDLSEICAALLEAREHAHNLEDDIEDLKVEVEDLEIKLADAEENNPHN